MSPLTGCPFRGRWYFPMTRSRFFSLAGFLLLALGLAGCDPPPSTPPAPAAPPAAGTPETSTTPTTPTTPTTTDAKEPSTGLDVKEATSAKPVDVVIQTSKGAITLELDPGKAPATVKNFLSYVRKGFYSGTIFHRVIADFMIQGGGFTPDMTEKDTDSPITNEAGNGLHNERGTIAMARTSDPNSATAQFFINTVDNTSKLDRDAAPDGFGYAVFGKVTKGMDVVDEIRNVPTKVQMSGPMPFENVPATPVVIKSVTTKE